jgi:DNA helicase II / ATP-dependent DNA helicase PcrA
MRLGIIGSAGRNGQKMTKDHMRLARRHVINHISDKDDEIILVSGGSAWMDHIAVQLFLRGRVNGLILCLPAKLKPDGQYENTAQGIRLNQLHTQCQKITGYDVFHELSLILDNERVTIHYDYNFKKRNKRIADISDYLIAFTFGTDSPDSAGTLDTWKQVKKTRKHHIKLNMLE